MSFDHRILQQHRIKDTSGDTYQLLSNPTHVWGVRGLKIQVVPFSYKTDFTSPSSTLIVLMLRSFVEPTKFVSRSDLICFTGGRSATTFCRMKEEALISSTTSMCTPLVVKHVNSMVHLLQFGTSPRVRLVTMFQGPKASRPTYVNGGPGCVRSMGRSAISVAPHLSVFFGT